VALTADVVVVGAGVLGSSIAFELARSGRAVVVVDKASGPGQGSTSASSAVVRFNYSTWDGIALSWESKHCWERWADHLEGVDPAGMATFHRAGMVFLDVDVAPTGRVVEMFDRAGIPYELWDADELARRVPGLDPGRFWPPKRIEDPAFWADPDSRLGALWTPDAGFVDDPGLAAVNLAGSARRRGAQLLFGRQVTAVIGDGPVTGVLLDDGTSVSAPLVVNAAGPWSGALNRLAGVGDAWSVTVRPMRQEVHQVPAPAGYNRGGMGPVVADLDLGVYLRGTPGDGLLVGGTEPECDELQWVEDPDAVNPNPTQQVYEAQITRAARRLPELGVPGKPAGIAGVYDVTDDWTPIYDGTEREGYYVAIGTSGNQFKNAPMVGRLMRAVVEGETSVVGEHAGLEIGLAGFGRLRPRNADSTGTVMG
jgi:glycine/D-amino acid oxidase-like deaminating enzyme